MWCEGCCKGWVFLKGGEKLLGTPFWLCANGIETSRGDGENLVL